MLYLIRFDVKQPENVPNQELIETWRREAVAATGAREAGVIKHIWKVAGQRVVFVIVDLPAHEALDRALGGLPIFRELGAGVVTEALPVYDYAIFADDLHAGVHGG